MVSSVGATEFVYTTDPVHNNHSFIAPNGSTKNTQQ